MLQTSVIVMLVPGKPPLLEDEKPYPIEAAQASAMTVETTAYALLQALSRNDIDYATPIARWPPMQQNYGGGFHSTQDTIIALEASSRYYFAFLKREEEINMQIQFHGFGSPFENTIHLRRHNALTEKELKYHAEYCYPDSSLVSVRVYSWANVLVWSQELWRSRLWDSRFMALCCRKKAMKVPLIFCTASCCILTGLSPLPSPCPCEGRYG
ncbi:pregnancy zone protein-like [Stegostoma tigrinum]|uniref:pregnancy zone protein-like n=1 Tax=Stegostoma tigrinum TaxID=3053191 RepID=UPI00286FF33D|nr:pregnancy zone protein-like [Stegostoma tigrinum]